MRPAELRAESFARYPPEARERAIAHLAVLQRLPLSFVPSLLRELIEYDYKFPVERRGLDRELALLASLTPAQMDVWFRDFAAIRTSGANERFDWVSKPAEFTDQLSASLWSTHQMDAFRAAAMAYGDRLRAANPPEPPAMPRLGIAVIGQGVDRSDAVLFRRLRAHGTYFRAVDPRGGLDQVLQVVADRAASSPAPYAHWYVDGGIAEGHGLPHVTSISYAALHPVREALLQNIQHEVEKPGMGPEDLHAYLSGLVPNQLGMKGDGLLDRFQLKLLTEGSGTQIFSTTYAQWAAREVLRRAEALTLLVRFAPRQRERPMSELLSSNHGPNEVDPIGSLVDADMGAYYHWLNQQRLAGADKSAFVVWFEGHAEALAIGPALPKGVESSSPISLTRLVGIATGA